MTPEDLKTTGETKIGASKFSVLCEVRFRITCGIITCSVVTTNVSIAGVRRCIISADMTQHFSRSDTADSNRCIITADNTQRFESVFSADRTHRSKQLFPV